MSSTRCGYPRPTVIPVCRRVETMWSINRAILTPDPDPDSDDDYELLRDDIVVPWTRRSLRTGGPCDGPIERMCE